MLRKRRIFLFTIFDYWFDREGFIGSDKGISILHTNEVIDKSYYSFKIISITSIIDLQENQENIYNNFKKRSLQNSIKKAEQMGIYIVKSNSEQMIRQLFSFFLTFSLKKAIPLIKIEELDKYNLFHAYSKEGNYLGGCAFIEAEDKSIFRYKHGATLKVCNENDLLLWEAIKYARDNGFRFFDMGGIIITENANSFNYSHFKYKEKFGGELKEFYSYIKVRGVLFYFVLIFDIIVKCFFKHDYNKIINYLSKGKVLR